MSTPKTLLLCPADRPGSEFLAARAPLPLLPVLGRTVLDRTLAHMAQQGEKAIRIVATDRPASIRQSLQNGLPWGIEAEVVTDAEERAAEEAVLRHGGHNVGKVMKLNAWPTADQDLWESPQILLNGLLAHLAEAAVSTVSMHEMGPGIYISTHAQVSPGATLHAPCWIGPHAIVRDGATVGPGAIIENKAWIDTGASVSQSWVGPSTYLGSGLDLQGKFAWGTMVMDAANCVISEMVDPLLMTDMGARLRTRSGSRWFGRIAAACLLLLTSPVLIIAWLAARLRHVETISRRRVINAPCYTRPENAPTIVTRRFEGLSGMWSRWPELWNVACGEFGWTGNRPLSREQASSLCDDHERLWLAIAPGFYSLADDERGLDSFDHWARAHAAWFATCATARDRRRLIRKGLLRLLLWHPPAFTHHSPQSYTTTPQTQTSPIP